mgnify:CR=1 FL=1
MTTQQTLNGYSELNLADEKIKLEVNDLRLYYGESLALKNINLVIKPGEKIGIIGRSGSGKSSLAKLLVGLYQPDSGSLLVDGVDIRQIDVSELRYNIGYVPQDIQLLAGTLRDNLTLGLPIPSDSVVLSFQSPSTSRPWRRVGSKLTLAPKPNGPGALRS